MEFVKKIKPHGEEYRNREDKYYSCKVEYRFR